MEKLMPRTRYRLSTVTPLLFRRISLLHSFLPHHIQHRRSVSENSSAVIMQEERPHQQHYAIDPAKDFRGKEVCNVRANTKHLSDQIIPHILNLYGAIAKPSDFSIYAENASFEDPLTHAKGVKEIKSAFYSLSKIFNESKIVEYTVEEKEISPGKQEILIDSKQHYVVMGKTIDMVSLIKLYTEDGKIVRHEDWWDKKPLKNRETVDLPGVGRMMEAARRGSMLATHAMMGFGKDPNSGSSNNKMD